MGEANRLRLVLAQLNLLVGDVRGNLARVQHEAERARAAGADLILFPELALSGYPPEDLLFHRGFRRHIDAAQEELAASVPDIGVLLGCPEYVDHTIYNSAVLFGGGRILARHRKQRLPNYQVFDEKRYFTAGDDATVVEFRGFRLGLLICEDLWGPGPAEAAARAGAEILVLINASPYEIHKQRERERVARERVAETQLPVVYVNLCGAQDELVFDGNSFVMDATGQLVFRAPAHVEGTWTIEFERRDGRVRAVPATVAPEQSDEESVYGALVQGVRDYVGKHRFPGVVLGLSGGVDSALVLAIAVDALGADHVQAVVMPSRYTRSMSIEDAHEQARLMGVAISDISIEGLFEAALAALKESFAGREPDATEENIQARCRGILLMAISNKTRRMLLTTGNKSEMAVGYATLYGDMAGGFAPIKDCGKLLVYRLANYRNRLGYVIPQRVIEREPSAELRADQADTDSLPPYEILDPILEAFIEEDLSVDEIVARGFERATVARVLDLVQRNEYKRRQAPPGVRVSRRAFGRDWRYPITSGYRR
jgi:NAD+ synthase (glutamine-hydrolysing)